MSWKKMGSRWKAIRMIRRERCEIYIYIYIYIEDAYGDTPPPPVSGFLTTAVTVDMEGVELFVKRNML